jgi:hypothetical protein
MTAEEIQAIKTKHSEAIKIAVVEDCLKKARYALIVEKPTTGQLAQAIDDATKYMAQEKELNEALTCS